MKTLRCSKTSKGSHRLQHSSSAAARVLCSRAYCGGVKTQRLTTLLTANSNALTADALVSNAVPYPSRAEPKLRSRRMADNPAEGLWAAVTSAILRLELLSAATIDKHERVGPAVMSLLAGISTAMGLDAITLIGHGVPAHVEDLLFEAFAAWDTTLWGLAFTAAALPVTAWALRCWWVSSVELLNTQGGAVTQLQQLLTGVQGSLDQQQPPQQQDANSSSGGWVAGLLTIIRGLCLGSAVSSFTQILLASSTTGKAIAAAAALASFVVAAAPVAWQVGSKQHRTAAVALLATEAACVLALVGIAPAVSAVAAAVMSAGLYTAHQQVVMPRLAPLQASGGDEVQVHVSLRVAGTKAVFDSTLTSQPLKLLAGQLDPEFLEAWKDMSFDEVRNPDPGSDTNSQEAQEQQQQQTDTSSSSGTPSTPNSSLQRVNDGIESWMTDPAARWDTLSPFAAAAACGMYLGETRTVKVYNPKGVGYWNPTLSWWQPTEDVLQKFGGQLPSVGDVFWYPVAEGAYVQTRVAGVGQKHVELDANYGVVGSQLEMDVQLVKLQKQ